MSERPTIKDVARAAGVSAATASRALSGTRTVAPELKARVREAAAELDYNPNFAARALRSAKTGAVGMVIPMIDNPFFPSLVSAIESLLQERGYSLLLCSSQEDIKLEAQRIRALTERQVDGLLVTAASCDESIPALQRAADQLPVVQLDQRAEKVATPYVGIDDSAGIRDVVEHLAERGRTHLGYIGASDANWSGIRRHAGFEHWATRVDPDSPLRMRLGTFTREFGRRAALELLNADAGIDGLVCANDLIALGALDAARELRLAVPSDLAVAGFDDIDVSTASTPMLTTVAQPVEQIASAAVATLLEMMSGADVEPAALELRGELVVRGST